MNLISPDVTGRAAGKYALSIQEFCDGHGLSRSMYYVLRKSGQGPIEMVVGNRRLISVESAAAWRRDREHLAMQPAA